MRPVALMIAAVSVGGGIATGLASEEPAVGIAVVILVALIALVPVGYLWADRLADRLLKTHPVETAFAIAAASIPVGGAAITYGSKAAGFHLEQEVDQFTTLAQVLVALLIAFSIELVSMLRAGAAAPKRDERLALFVGLGLGGALGLASALLGVLHPDPGLFFVGVAVMASLLLTALVAISVPLRALWGEESGRSASSGG